MKSSRSDCGLQSSSWTSKWALLPLLPGTSPLRLPCDSLHRLLRAARTRDKVGRREQRQSGQIAGLDGAVEDVDAYPLATHHAVDPFIGW